MTIYKLHMKFTFWEAMRKALANSIKTGSNIFLSLYEKLLEQMFLEQVLKRAAEMLGTIFLLKFLLKK